MQYNHKMQCTDTSNNVQSKDRAYDQHCSSITKYLDLSHSFLSFNSQARLKSYRLTSAHNVFVFYDTFNNYWT